MVNIQVPTTTAPSPACASGLQAADVGIPRATRLRAAHHGARGAWRRRVKISKRAGSYVTLRDLIEWTSKDAVRFFLLSRKPDTEYTFDVDLAVAQNNDNPCTTCSTPMRASSRCCAHGKRRAAAM